MGFDGAVKKDGENPILNYLKNSGADILCLQEYQTIESSHYLSQKDVEKALKDYPYTDYREELSILILRARHEMAIYSVEDKKMDRYRETIDEYYAFKNEFPESKYLKEAEKIFNESQKVIKD